MKYMPILLLFCLACTAAKPTQAPADIRIALLDNGQFVEYDAASQDSTRFPHLERLGHGRMYATGGYLQSDTTTGFFFRFRQ